MKNSLPLIFVVLILTIFAQSCTIEKRRYSRGFYVRSNNLTKSEVKRVKDGSCRKKTSADKIFFKLVEKPEVLKASYTLTSMHLSLRVPKVWRGRLNEKGLDESTINQTIPKAGTQLDNQEPEKIEDKSKVSILGIFLAALSVMVILIGLGLLGASAVGYVGVFGVLLGLGLVVLGVLLLLGAISAMVIKSSKVKKEQLMANQKEEVGKSETKTGTAGIAIGLLFLLFGVGLVAVGASFLGVALGVIMAIIGFISLITGFANSIKSKKNKKN